MPILLGACFLISAFSYGQDYTGDWYSTGINAGDSSKLSFTEDSLVYISLDKPSTLVNPYAYKLIARKKKKDGVCLFMLDHGAAAIHIIENYYPDSCLSIYMSDIVHYNDLILPLTRKKEFADKLKKFSKRKYFGMTLTFYTKKVFEGFRSLTPFSSIKDSITRESVMNNLVNYRRDMRKKFGDSVFEDFRFTQWLYFNFFVSEHLYPFSCYDDVMKILKEKNWPE